MRKFFLFWGIYLAFALTVIAVVGSFHLGIVDGWIASYYKPAPSTMPMPGPTVKSAINPDKVKTREFDLSEKDAWVKKLKEGGLVIVMRHASRNSGENDSAFDRMAAIGGDSALPPEYKSGVCINETGKAEAALFHEIFTRLAIPFSEVISSPVCRSRQTAEIAFGKVDVLEPGLMCPDMLTPEELKNAAERAGKYYLTAPAKGTNRALVMHSCSEANKPFGIALPSMSSVSVLQHDDDGKILITNFRLNDFARLLPVRIDQWKP